MIYLSQLRRHLQDVDDELERRDWGNWPLSEHEQTLVAFLRQHGVTVADDTEVVDLDKVSPVG